MTNFIYFSRYVVVGFIKRTTLKRWGSNIFLNFDQEYKFNNKKWHGERIEEFQKKVFVAYPRMIIETISHKFHHFERAKEQSNGSHIRCYTSYSLIVCWVIPVSSICMIWVFPIHSTSIKKDTEWSVIFLRNDVLILNRKENKEASAICFKIRIPKKKNKELLRKVP